MSAADKRIQAILKTLIASQTVTGANKAAGECLDYIEAFLISCGMFVERSVAYGYPTLMATSQPRKDLNVILQAHLDVVPASDELFLLKKQGGRLYGRGTFDMKFAAACFMVLAEELRHQMSSYNFGIMFTMDEEAGDSHGVSHLLDKGYTADVCILPDGADNWQLETSAKGAWFVKAISAGKATHGSRPWEGVNAIENMMKFLEEVKFLFIHQSKDSDSLSITSIRAGEAYNQIPDKAEAGLDIRFISTENFEALQTEISEIATRHQVELHTGVLIDAVFTDPNLPLVRCWQEIVTERTGKPAKYMRSLGASDARFFNSKGIPTIIMRPRGGGAHGDNEWIHQNDLGLFYAVIRQYVETIALVPHLDINRDAGYHKPVTKDSALSF